MTLTITFATLIAVALLELWRPRRKLEFPALRRRIANISIWLGNLVLGGLIFTSPDTVRPQFEASLGFALPSWPIANPWLSFVIGFLFLDFFSYWIHRAQHAIPLAWRAHSTHHMDPLVDWSTAVLHHPIEYVWATAAFWFAVLVLDIPITVAAVHGLTVFCTAALTHCNVRLPGWLERVLAPIIITVDAHRIHHSRVYEHANTNFGAVCSCWDVTFGTYRRLSAEEHDNLEFGIAELAPQDCLKLSAMLMAPLRLGGS